MTKRIAITSRNLRGKTGVSAIVLAQVRQLVAAGHEVDVIGEKLDEKMIRQAGGNATRLRRLPGPRYAARRFFSTRVDRIAAKNNYDLIVGNSEILHQDVLFMHNLTHLEHETVPGSNSSGLLSKMRFDEELFRKGRFSYCIANSELMKRDLAERHNLDPAIIRIAHPGIDPDTFSATDRNELRDTTRAELCEADDLLVGFITSGNFAKRGADIMLESFQLLTPGLQQRIKVLAVGSEKNTSALRRSAESHQLPIEIIAQGKTNDIARYYHATDLLFYPARVEEFGLVALEAAACGTPVLTSARTGAAEVLDTGEDFLAPAPNATEFGPRLTRLLEDPAQLHALAEHQEKAAAQQTWQHYFDTVFSVYAELDL